MALYILIVIISAGFITPLYGLKDSYSSLSNHFKKQADTFTSHYTCMEEMENKVKEPHASLKDLLEYVMAARYISLTRTFLFNTKALTPAKLSSDECKYYLFLLTHMHNHPPSLFQRERYGIPANPSNLEEQINLFKRKIFSSSSRSLEDSH